MLNWNRFHRNSNYTQGIGADENCTRKGSKYNTWSWLPACDYLNLILALCQESNILRQEVLINYWSMCSLDKSVSQRNTFPPQSFTFRREINSTLSLSYTTKIQATEFSLDPPQAAAILLFWSYTIIIKVLP